MTSARPHPARLRILLTQDRRRETEHWTTQLPQLLAAIGIETATATSGEQALDLAKQQPVHAAFVDLGTPRMPDQAPTTAEADQPGGLWLLRVLRTQPSHPAVIIVNGHAYSQKRAQRFHNEALRLGAFSVINRPIQLEQMLSTAKRVMDRMQQDPPRNEHLN